MFHMVSGLEKRFFKSRVFVPIVLFIFCLAFFAFGRAYYRDYEIRQEIAKMETEVKRLQSKKVETLEFLDFVKSDVFAEEQARLNLNLVRPGEQLAVVSGGVKKVVRATSQTEPKIVQSIEIANFLQWWYYFMGEDNNI